MTNVDDTLRRIDAELEAWETGPDAAHWPGAPREGEEHPEWQHLGWLAEEGLFAQAPPAPVFVGHPMAGLPRGLNPRGGAYRLDDVVIGFDGSRRGAEETLTFVERVGASLTVAFRPLIEAFETLRLAFLRVHQLVAAYEAQGPHTHAADRTVSARRRAGSRRTKRHARRTH